MKNHAVDYFNLYSARISPNNKMHGYLITEFDSKRLSSSPNKKRSISHKEYIDINPNENEIIMLNHMGKKIG